MPRPKKHTKQFRKNVEKARYALETMRTGMQEGEGDQGGALLPPPPQALPPPTPTSAEKRKKITAEAGSSSDKERVISNTEYVVIKKNILIEYWEKKGVCDKCYSSDVECVFTHMQIDTRMKVSCKVCHNVMIDNIDDCKITVSNKGMHPVTVMLVYAVMLLGYSFSAVEKICGILSLPHFTNKTYTRISKFITEKSKINVSDILERSRKAVVQFYANELGRVPDENGILDLDVTFDGSWHTRGHKSLLGVGAIVDANTGLILDYETLSKFCVKCNMKMSALSKKKITQEEFDQWKEGHAPLCDINYKGTSGGMEPAAAQRMLQRSLQSGFRYINIISDGDSSTIIAIKSLNNNTGPYGAEHQIVKEECVNHVSKRLGTGLRNLLKQTAVEVIGGKRKRKTMGGKNKLTEHVITRLQHYFGISVRRKTGTTVSEMRDDILASYYHCSSTDTKSNHELCPKTKDSWCFYQEAIANGKEPKSHKDMKIHFELTDDQLALVKGVYDRLTTDDMMLKCLRGKTQNPNESLHSRIWRYCPKHKNATANMLQFATCQAVANYNVGYVESNLHQLLGIPYTKANHKYLKAQDAAMNIPIKRKMRNRRLQMDLAYAAGSF